MSKSESWLASQFPATMLPSEQARLLELASDGILVRDLAGIIRFWNCGAERLYGWPRTEAVGRLVQDLLQTRYPQRREEIEARVYQTGRWEGELEHRRRNGSRVIVSSRWALERDSQGEPYAILELNTDVSDRKLAEARQAVRFSVTRALATASDLEDAALPVLECVGNGFGWKIGELWQLRPGGGLQCSALWHAGAEESATIVWPSAILRRGKGLPGKVWESGQPAWIRDVRSDPDFVREPLAVALGLRSALAFPILASGGVVGVLLFLADEPSEPAPELVATMLDISRQFGLFTDRVSAVQALRRSEAKFRALLESAPDAILIVDRRGHITLSNHRVQELFGYRPNELEGGSVELLVPERFRAAHLRHRLVFNEAPQARPMGVGLELFGLHKNGTEFPVEISLSPTRIGDDLITMAAIRDISARKQAELDLQRLHALELAQSEHLATLGEIAAGLAHEIKNPLAGIAAALDVLVGEISGARGEVMGEVQAQVGRIQVIVDDLLHYARPRPLRLQQADLNASVEHVLLMAMRQAEARQIALDFIPGALPPVAHDVDYIQRMVLNLALNAIEAVPEHGRVTVRTEHAAAHPGVVRILVRDNGSGIAPADLERIFRPFFTTKGKKGNGLGLSLCRRIAELHHGAIAVESRLGEGSVVIVTLPLQPPRASEAVH